MNAATTKSLVLAGEARHVAGMTFIPIISQHMLSFEKETFMTIVPIGIYFIDEEVYFPLVTHGPDYTDASNFQDVLKRAAEQE